MKRLYPRHPKYLCREGVFFNLCFWVPTTFSRGVWMSIGIVFYIFLINITWSLNVLSFRSMVSGVSKSWRFHHRCYLCDVQSVALRDGLWENAGGMSKFAGTLRLLGSDETTKTKVEEQKSWAIFLSHRIHVWNIYLHELGGGFKYFLFSSLLGEMIQFD